VYADGIRSVVGEEKYNTISNAIIETVGEPSNEDILNPFSKEKKFTDKAMNVLSRNFAVATLGFKISSVMMQPLSTGAAALRMGPTGGRYIVKALGHYLKNITNYKEMFAEAGEINSDILRARDAVDDSMVKGYFSEFPKSRLTKNNRGQLLEALEKGKQAFVDAAMIGLKQLDLQIKVIVTLAANAQFLDGNVKNFPQSKTGFVSKLKSLSREIVRLK